MNWKSKFNRLDLPPLDQAKQERRQKLVEITKEIRAHMEAEDISAEEFAKRFPEIITEYNRLRSLDSGEIQA